VTVIDRYIIRSFLGGYVILLAIFVCLYILLDLMVNIDEFTKDSTRSFGQVLSVILDFYKYNLPLYYSQIGGAVLSIAAAFTVAMMLRNNELVALIAAGMPLPRLTAPLITCSVVMIAAWMANRELVVPALADKIARTHDDVVGVNTVGVHCARDDNNAILTANKLDPRTGEMFRIYIIEPDASGKPANLVTADSARYDPDRRAWRLERGLRITYLPRTAADGLGSPISQTPVNEFNFSLTPEQLILRREAQWADLLSLKQLNTLLQSRNLSNRTLIDTSRHIRLTQPLVQLILLLLPLPFFLTREPTNIIAAGGKALLMSGAFYLTVFLSQSVVKDESSAALVAWLPILAFGPVAILQLSNSKT